MSLISRLFRIRGRFRKAGDPETMTAILRIDSSTRGTLSASRQLGDHLQARLLAADPSARITHRDLAQDAPPHLDIAAITGFFTPPELMSDDLRAATAHSDALVAELHDADILILTVPMINFAVPSSLKAWIDHVVRVGRTFSYDGQAFAGMLTTRRAYVLCAYGATGYAPGAPFAAADFVEPYLRHVLGFLGIADIVFVTAEGTSAGDDATQAQVARALAAIDELAGVPAGAA